MRISRNKYHSDYSAYSHAGISAITIGMNNQQMYSCRYGSFSNNARSTFGSLNRFIASFRLLFFSFNRRDASVNKNKYIWNPAWIIYFDENIPTLINTEQIIKRKQNRLQRMFLTDAEMSQFLVLLFHSYTRKNIWLNNEKKVH